MERILHVKAGVQLMAIVCLTVLALAPDLLAQTSQPPKPSQSAGVTQPQSGATAEPKAIEQNPATRTSPDAILAASYRCSTEDSKCPLSSNTLAGDIKDHFHEPLAGGKAPAPLAKSLEMVLKGPKESTPSDDVIFPADVDTAIVHLVRGTRKSSLEDWWIVASRSGNEIKFSEDKRIMGKRRIQMVFVHVDPEKAPDMTLSDLYGRISYRAIVAGKTAINVQNLLSALRIPGVLTAQGKSDDKTTRGFCGWGTLNDTATPSDMTFIGVDRQDVAGTPRTDVIGQTMKYDNEGKHWWDVSVAVPVSKLSAVDYSQEAGVFTPKQINLQSIYGVFDVYPVPVDLKSGNARFALPRVIGGIGLTGRPGQSILAGLAFGIPQFQIFIGRAWVNRTEAADATQPVSAMNSKQTYKGGLAFGINVPVMSVLQAGKPKATAK